MLTDLKQSLRSLARSPWHVVTVAVCLGIGIAVSVTVFSILSSILIGDMPGVRDRRTLMNVVLVVEQSWGRLWSGASRNDFDLLRRGTPHLPQVAAEGSWLFAIDTPQTGPLAVEGQFVSGNYFDVLGTQPAMGRLLTPADDSPGASPSAVLSHAFWHGRLGAPGNIVGSTIQVGGMDVLVAGVAPEHFSGTAFGNLGEPPGERFKLYLPLSLSNALARTVDDDDPWLQVVGRAAPDVSPEALAAELLPMARAIEAGNPRGRKGAQIVVTRSGAAAGDSAAVVAAIVALLMAAPLTVLAIACANVANLQLVRATRRARELAVRVSIGASRWQLVRLLTLEAAILTAAAIGAGAFGTALLLRLAARLVPFHVEIAWPVVAFVAALAIVVVGATGVLPGWVATRMRGVAQLGGTSRATAPGAGVRRTLVVAQVALSLLLLLVATLFTRSLETLAGRVPPVARDVVVAQLRFDTLGYTDARRTQFMQTLQARLSQDPAVRSVGVNTVAPLRQGNRRFWLASDHSEQHRWADGGDVTAGWFDAAGLPVLRGRTFDDADMSHGLAAVVDQAFVERYRLEEPVVGSTIRVERVRPGGDGITDDTRRTTVDTVTIVGVVGNSIARPLSPRPPANLYLPLRTVPSYVAIYVRTAGAAGTVAQVRTAMSSLDPHLPPIEVATLADRYGTEAGDLRMLAQTASGLGTAALLLAVAGIYSVVAFFVSLRTHEFGIRLAIGAAPRDIVRMVLLQAGRLVGVGILAGGVLSVPVLIGLDRGFPMFPGLGGMDLLLPAALLAFTAALAASLPARRAARVEPTVVLRSD